MTKAERIHNEWLQMKATLESIKHRTGGDVTLPDDLEAEVDCVLRVIDDRQTEETMADLRRLYPSSE